MFKVLVVGVLMANLALLSRFWQPRRGRWLYHGLRAAALGSSISCMLALILALLFPGPYRLSIYTLALNLLLTPTLATGGMISELRRSKPQSDGKSPSFGEVMSQVAGPQETACEGHLSEESQPHADSRQSL